MARINLRNRRTLYILLGVSIAVLSVGLGFLKSGIGRTSSGEAVVVNTTPRNTNEYQILDTEAINEEFQLSTDTAPGNTDEYDSQIIGVYLERNQELNVSFQAQGAPIMFQVYTPSDQILGYSLGSIEPNRSIATKEGNFKYNALETGTYEMNIKSTIPLGLIDVFLEYWIQ
jgi:hypothetical protein